MAENLIRHAIAAVQRGWSVFPCNPSGARCPQDGHVIDKQPHLITPGQPYKIKWGEWATTDLNRIIEAWAYSPLANVAVACKPSGLLVVDCDFAKTEYALKGTPYEHLHEQLGPVVDGHDVLEVICQQHDGDWGELNDTYQVTTSRFGRHLHFRWPAGLLASQASIVKGLVDIRCNGGTQGGYILAAGSVVMRGASMYEGDRYTGYVADRCTEVVPGPYVTENDLPVREAPRWLIELCRERPRPTQPRPLFAQPRRGGSIGGLVETVRNAPDGDLNSALFWAARAACSDGIPIETAVDELGAAYVDAHGRGGHRQAEASIRSAYRNQSRKEGL